MVRQLSALLLIFFAVTANSSDIIKVSAPKGLVSQELIRQVESSTGYSVKMYEYMASSSALTALSIEPDTYDMILIDESYLKEPTFSSFIKSSGGPNHEASDSPCRAYATGKTAVLSNRNLPMDSVNWDMIVSGALGHLSTLDFGSLTEAGITIIKVLASETCLSEQCIIETVSGNIRILKAKREITTSNAAYTHTLLPDYLAHQLADRQPGFRAYDISDNRIRWVKHWCSLKSTPRDVAKAFLDAVYDQENLTLNARETGARILGDNVEDAVIKLPVVQYPGDDKFKFYSTLVGIGESIYEN